MKSGCLAIVLLALFATIPTAQAQWWNAKPVNAQRSSSQSTGGTTFGGATSGYPIGTYTSESPRYFPSAGLSPAPGVSSHTGVPLSPGEFMYYNNPALGYYRANPNAAGVPAYRHPISLGGGYYQLGGLTERLGYWRAASGYYYPWFPAVYMPGIAYGLNSVIYSVRSGALTPTQPPASAVLEDMRQFVEQAKEKGQLDQSNYENLSRRINELATRAPLMDETAARREIDLLSADLARSLNP